MHLGPVADPSAGSASGPAGSVAGAADYAPVVVDHAVTLSTHHAIDPLVRHAAMAAFEDPEI